MSNDITRQRARFLFGFGKRMREFMFKIHTKVMSNNEISCINEDFSPPQLHMLLAIHERGETSISQLAETLGVSVPSVSAMVDKLVEKGALVRERSIEDRRVVVVKLSDTAANHVRMVENAMLDRFALLVEKLEPEQVERWCQIVDEVGQVLEKERI